MTLVDWPQHWAERTPEAVAIRGPDAVLTYGELDALSDRAAAILRDVGVVTGDRVGIWVEKSARAVVAMLGTLKLGAAYVPIDPASPIGRAATIIEDCRVKALITTRDRQVRIEQLTHHPVVVPCDVGEAGATWPPGPEPISRRLPPVIRDGNRLAYILYTSGSTGTPKGVCISHDNAAAFVEWATCELDARGDDTFANHAPFHFDLSVLDLYGAFRVGAAVAIVPETIAGNGGALVEFLHQHAVSVWYSVPFALMLMLEDGGLDKRPPANLRTVIFAGDVFPIRDLKRLRNTLPNARLLNFYGPTETNVCTFYEVGDVAVDRETPVPIGKPCSGCRAWVDFGDPDDAEGSGELVVAGPSVMLGYWGAEPQADRPYATGDLVKQDPDGNFVFIGRRDHQVKLRGYRVELGEVEAAVVSHEAIETCAVVVRGSGKTARLIAFVTCRNERPPSLIALKRHCSERLPRYMIIDRLRVLDALPRSSNGKIDRGALKRMADPEA